MGEEGEIKMGCGGWWDGWSLEGRGIEREGGWGDSVWFRFNSSLRL